MNTVPVKVFSTRIAPLVDGAPDFLICRAVVDTVMAVCKETLCLTTETAFRTKPYENEYDIPMPDGLDIEQIRWAYCDGWQLRVKTQDELARMFMPMDWKDCDGMPLYYSFRKKNHIVFAPVPEKTYHIRLSVAANVERETDNVPELFFTDYVDCITFGAVARLLRTAGQSFSNFQLGELYQARYEGELDGVRSDAVQDYTRNAGHVFYNGWAL